MNLNDNIAYLPGVGPQKARILAADLDIHTAGQLLHYFPYRHIDQSHTTTIASLTPDTNIVVLRGRITNLQSIPTGRNRERLIADFDDGTGHLQLIWFAGTKWVQQKINPSTPYIIIGRPTIYNNQWQITHPELEAANNNTQQQHHSFMPVYNTTDKMKQHGLGTRAIAKLINTLIHHLDPLDETLPPHIIHKYHLASRQQALTHIHFPDTTASLDAAYRRLKFEELFLLQLDYQYARQQRTAHSRGHLFTTVGQHFNTFYHTKLPFALTEAQKRVIREVRQDTRTGRQMNRLIQGDVGSGKTLVALMCMLLALDNGCQACLMAPTEILATQHYTTFQNMLDGLGINVALLTGSLRASEKKRIKQNLADGVIHILIGTHALIEDSVVFHNIGLVVIDEQHRFGVEQRAKLWTKAAIPPHILVMTATPIPRTLAMTLYGDLDCSVIDELPPGRQPVRTIHRQEAHRLQVFGFLKQQIDNGRQVYIVYPLIEESEKSDMKNLYDGLEMVQSYFPRPDYQVSIVHGRLTAEEKASEMERFKQKKTHIMVATTVIEVGVDVPNATVMLIENAERFGLSQLHQLRGRVGRGGGQAYCILMTADNLSYTSQQRIRTMCATTDGFRIAEADLKLRGPGDIQGLAQSGILDLKLASIVDDEPIVSATRNEVHDLLAADPTLATCPMLATHIDNSKNKLLWSKIS